jgi:pimeloyl-ACP methyl ester carboxylesterase
MDKYIKFKGKYIRFQTEGDEFAPHCFHNHRGAVVFLHGYLGTLEIWTEIAKAISAYTYVVSIDLPGHGFSASKDSINSMEYMADAINAVRKELGVNRILLVGHSMGGYAALTYAERYEQHTLGVCLFHSTPNADSVEKINARKEEIKLLLSGKENVAYRANLAKLFAPQNLERMALVLNHMTRMLELCEPSGIAACVRGMQRRKDKNDFLLRFHKPLLMVFGRNDQYISEQTAKDIAARFSNAQIAWLEHSGHLGFVEEQAEAIEILMKFTRLVL